MDYSRVYRDFIADRRGRVPSGYFERHHIVPRSLGGSNEGENLIDLSPEDHYFAHLLLAKIHGGRLASALQLLADIAQKKWAERTMGRRAYGFGQRLAARLKAEDWSAEGNPLFNSTSFEWLNYRSGARETATLYSMHQKHGASRGSWTQVAKGERPSIKGWLLANRADAHKYSDKGQVVRFVNRDGRTFEGTQGEFAAAQGINLASASRVARQQSVTRCGWRREGVRDRPANYGKDGLPAHQKR